jgi:hypothetical protein
MRPLARTSALLLLAACGSAAGDLPQLEAPPLALEVDFAYGALDGPRSLTWFRGMVVGPAGEIFTAHPMENRLRKFSAGGELVREIGREGQGPGEFRNIGTLGIVGDTLWVLDFSGYVFSYFDLDGNLLGSESVPVEIVSMETLGPPRPGGLLRDGTLFGAPPAWSEMVATGQITETYWARLSRAGEILDTIASYSLLNTTWRVTDPGNERAPRSYMAQPFTDTEIVSPAPPLLEILRVDRGAPADPERAAVRITKVSFAGDTLFTREFSYVPRPIRAAEVDSLVQSRVEAMTRSPFFGGAPAGRMSGWVRDGLFVPRYHPHVRSARIGRDGTVWLERDAPDMKGSEWVILSSEGDPLGVVITPPRFSLEEADREHVWGMLTDELEVPYLVRYRISDAVE